MIRARDPEGFERLRLRCEADPAIGASAQSHILFRTAVIIAAKCGNGHCCVGTEDDRPGG